MKLKAVRQGKYLHWPPEINTGDALWLGPGEILDVEDEFVAKCVVGQEYKLEETAAREATPFSNQRFFALRDAYRKAGEKQEEKKAELAVESDRLKGLPRPDVRPKRAEQVKS